MDNVIDVVIDSLRNIQELAISDKEKAAHITGIIGFVEALVNRALDDDK